MDSHWSIKILLLEYQNTLTKIHTCINKPKINNEWWLYQSRLQTKKIFLIFFFKGSLLLYLQVTLHREEVASFHSLSCSLISTLMFLTQMLTRLLYGLTSADSDYWYQLWWLWIQVSEFSHLPFLPPNNSYTTFFD